MTILDAIIQSLSCAGEYNRDDQVAPAVILWPDKERQWGPLLPILRERLPHLLTLGPYAANSKTGPAIWLRCMIARTLPPGIIVVERQRQANPRLRKTNRHNPAR